MALNEAKSAAHSKMERNIKILILKLIIIIQQS